ncbi:MAG: OmpA family protein, partial [Deltaproteobacteria bacterium]|nr:OmpA family protein [Deltaproteobacteria bacterium]
ELDELGGFLNKNPKAYAVLAGFIDNIGSREYNLGLGLSVTRARSGAEYITEKHDITPDRLPVRLIGEFGKGFSVQVL